MHQIINYILNQPSSTWTTIGAYLGGSAAIASVLQILKHKLNIAEAETLLTFLAGFMSFIVAFANYILQSTAQNPLALGRNTLYLTAAAMLVHRFAVSPIYTELVGGLGSLIKDAGTYRASVAPLSTTAGEAPAAPASVQTFEV